MITHWSADGYPGWSADGYTGWSADGYIPQFYPPPPPPAAVMRVRAVAAGAYYGDYKDIGDVFDIYSLADFSSSTVNQVPVGSADYPLYGWMQQVPASTALIDYSLLSGGASTPRTAPRRIVL